MKLEETRKAFSPLLGVGKDREEALFKIVTSLTLAVRYHRVEAGVFGSQLALLMDLNSKPLGLPVDDAKAFYDRAVQQYPMTYSSYTYEQWLGFLTSYDLIAVNNNVVALTVLGRGYINFLVKMQLPLNRAN